MKFNITDEQLEILYEKAIRKALEMYFGNTETDEWPEDPMEFLSDKKKTYMSNENTVCFVGDDIHCMRLKDPFEYYFADMLYEDVKEMIDTLYQFWIDAFEDMFEM